MRIMVYEGPKKLVIKEIDDLIINKDEIRIKTLYSGISHGTEMNVYRGVAPFFNRTNDGDVHLFRKASDNEKWDYPIKSCDPGVWYMGYASVGKVIEIGSDIKNIKVGDIVYSNAPHQSQVIKNENEVVKLPSGINPEFGIFYTNLITAFNGILDTRIKLGDNVAVSGLGVLGQLVVQMAKLSGASNVFGIDLVPKRLEIALKNGADKVFNPLKVDDVAYAIRKETNNMGTDAVIEVTGNQKALNEAIRIAAPDTVVTALGWYQGPSSSLMLSDEFHHNRITIRSSQTGNIDPKIRHMWDNERKEKICLDLLSKLELENLITHKIPFEDATIAYEMIDRLDKDIIQVVLTY